MASKKPPLRAVGEDEKPPQPTKPVTEKLVSKAIEGGERGLLVTLRAKIATDIDHGVPAHTLAGLTKQLLELDQKIRAIDLALEVEREASGGDGDEDPTEDEAFDASAI